MTHDVSQERLPTRSTTRKRMGLLLFSATTLLALLVLVMAGWSAVAAHGLQQSVPTLPPVNVLPNGVASGDVTQNSAVLWARSSTMGVVTFTYLITPGGSTLAITQVVTNANVPAKVVVNGLSADARYLYTATTSDGQVGSGTFQTPAELGTSHGLRIGVSGDWRGELRPYPAIANAPGRDLDLFVKLGDTIYADVASPAVPLTQTETITDFRKKHNEVYGLRYLRNVWAELQASTSVLAMIDDHEVTNNFAGGATADTDPRFTETTGLINDTALFETGIQAFGEYNPINSTVYSTTGDVRTDGEVDLYRYRTYGSDAAVFVLDGRSFRDAAITPINPVNPLGDLARFVAESFQAGRTLLSPRQLATLKADLLDAQAKGITWKFVAVPEPIQLLGPAGAEDRFEGYAAERTELLDFIVHNAISNVVFVAADYHGTIVNNLTYRASPASATYTQTNIFEITTGSVAYDAPLGPTAVDIGVAAGLIPAEQKALYDSLPVANDADSLPNDKDDFVKSYLHQQYNLLGYDLIGLDGSLVNAELLQGDYMAVHTYGWTEFEIAPGTQVLTVTTYGIPPYTETDMTTMPSQLITQTPTIVSQFRVKPVLTQSQLFLPIIAGPAIPTVKAEPVLQFERAEVTKCERQPAGNWFDGYTNVAGQPANGYQVVFSYEADGPMVTAPIVSGPHAGYEAWSPGYYSHIIRATGPIAGDWYVWIINDAGVRISTIAHWTSTGPGEGCNQATVNFYDTVE
ncbi:MAG: alkaline phosphatase D family protein [Caldilineaceae bacterium]